MAFWGTEVKPGKPYTHTADNSKGQRLHISQATLGNGNGTKKSVVQCNVGDKSPVYICSLFPEQNECCQLHIEFEELDDVVFSVIGPRSVHLSGYYLLVPGSRHSDHHDDDSMESFGEDIADTETEKSGDGEEEDGYEDSFIDDQDDPEPIVPSPTSSCEEAAETLAALHDRKPKRKRASFKRLKKKYRVSESDNENTSQEHNFGNGGNEITALDSEDEDTLTVASLWKSASNRMSEAEENNDIEIRETINKEAENGGKSSAASAIMKQSADAVADGELKRQPDQDEPILPSSEVGSLNDAKTTKKKKKHPKKEKELKAGAEIDYVSPSVLESDQAKQSERDDQSSRDVDEKNKEDKRTGNDEQPEQCESIPNYLEVGLENGAKPKKKKKKQAKKEKELKAEVNDSMSPSVNELDQAKQSETIVDDSSRDIDVKKEVHNIGNNEQPDQHQSLLHSADVGEKSPAKPKEKKKKQSKKERELKTGTEDNSVNYQNLQNEIKIDLSDLSIAPGNAEVQKTENDRENQVPVSLPNRKLVLGLAANIGRESKNQLKKEKGVGSHIPLNDSIVVEDKAQTKGENIEKGIFLEIEENQKQEDDKNVPSTQPKKKRKKPSKDKTTGAGSGINADVIIKDNANRDEFKSDGNEHEQNQRISDDVANQAAEENPPPKKKKKKKLNS